MSSVLPINRPMAPFACGVVALSVAALDSDDEELRSLAERLAATTVDIHTRRELVTTAVSRLPATEPENSKLRVALLWLGARAHDASCAYEIGWLIDRGMIDDAEVGAEVYYAMPALRALPRDIIGSLIQRLLLNMRDRPAKPRRYAYIDRKITRLKRLLESDFVKAARAAPGQGIGLAARDALVPLTKAWLGVVAQERLFRSVNTLPRAMALLTSACAYGSVGDVIKARLIGMFGRFSWKTRARRREELRSALPVTSRMSPGHPVRIALAWMGTRAGDSFAAAELFEALRALSGDSPAAVVPSLWLRLAEDMASRPFRHLPRTAQMLSHGSMRGDPETQTMTVIHERDFPGQMKEATRQRYSRLLSPIRLVRMPQAAREIGAVLNAEFPWFETVTDHLVRQLRLSEKFGHGIARISRPILLAGPPGCGKTRYTRRVAQLMGCPFSRLSAAGANSSILLRGSGRGYATERPSYVLEVMLEKDCANPVIGVEDLDRESDGNQNGSLREALLHFLEAEDSSMLLDECLMVHANLSRVLWFVNCNDASRLGQALASRFDDFSISNPSVKHLPIIVDQIQRDFAADHGIPLRLMPKIGEVQMAKLSRDCRNGEVSLRTQVGVIKEMLMALALANEGPEVAPEMY